MQFKRTLALLVKVMVLKISSCEEMDNLKVSPRWGGAVTGLVMATILPPDKGRTKIPCMGMARSVNLDLYSTLKEKNRFIFIFFHL